MSDPRARLLELLRRRSFRRGDFVLASGKRSDFFIDCKRTFMTGEGHLLGGQVVLEALETVHPHSGGAASVDALAAVPLGACPLVSAASLLAAQQGRALDVLFVRPERKDHGTGQRIEGAQNLEGRRRVVLVEDVVTTGGSSCSAIEALHGAGLQVLGVLALVDRLEGGRERLAAAGVELHAVFTRRDFIPDPA
jgi:orotate phosphoribosyltransferase